MGNEKTSAGRVNEKASKELGDFLLSLKLAYGKTKNWNSSKNFKKYYRL